MKRFTLAAAFTLLAQPVLAEDKLTLILDWFVNPDHAPIIVARGADRLALRLRRLAFLYGVVIVRNPALARLLYRCELHEPVPEVAYQVVANVYRSVREKSEPVMENLNA